MQSVTVKSQTFYCMSRRKFVKSPLALQTGKPWLGKSPHATVQHHGFAFEAKSFVCEHVRLYHHAVKNYRKQESVLFALGDMLNAFFAHKERFPVNFLRHFISQK